MINVIYKKQLEYIKSIDNQEQINNIELINNQEQINDATLLVDYIYLDADERRRFAQVGHEYLIEQIMI
jgi:hypothetical protein